MIASRLRGSDQGLDNRLFRNNARGLFDACCHASEGAAHRSFDNGPI